MSKKHAQSRGYKRVNLMDIRKLVEKGALTDEQKAMLFDRVVLEYEDCLGALRSEVGSLRVQKEALEDSVMWREHLISRLEKKVETLRTALRRSSERRKGHRYSGRQHCDKYAVAADGLGDTVAMSYEGIEARYAEQVAEAEFEKIRELAEELGVASCHA